MLKTGKRLKHKRLFSEDFKLKVVQSYELGKGTVVSLAEEFGINRQSVYNWIYKYSEYNKKSLQVVELKDSQQHKIRELEQKIRELERAVGRKQIHIDYLEKMMELAMKEYNIDIKKNYDTPQPGGSKKTGSK